MRTYAELPGLMTLMTGDEKHDASATSTLDVLWVLYDQILRVTPGSVSDPGRDRFLLSKGHGPAAYYAVLAAKGFIPESWLADFGSASSPLGYHPDRSLIPGVEIASGSLGHGLPLGVGVAHGLLAAGAALVRGCTCWSGDAELDEGSNSEAIVYAGGIGLPNLTVVAVDNQSSSWGWGPGGIEAHFAAAGWSATRVSGRDHDALAAAFTVTSAAFFGFFGYFFGFFGAAARGGYGREERVSPVTDMRSVFAETASALLEEDPLTAVVLAEISADLFAKSAAHFPSRVLNVGIREQLMVSVAGGLALTGMRPIVHTYAPFLVERAFEQVKLDLGHQGVGAVLVSIGASYDAASAGRTHQAPEDVALLDSVPGFSVLVPGHPDEVDSLLRSAVGIFGVGVCLPAAFFRYQCGGAAGFPVAAGGSVGATGGGGRGGAYVVAGALGRLGSGCDRGVRDYGAAVRRFWAAFARGLVGNGGAGGAVPGGDVFFCGVGGAGVAAAPAAQPGGAAFGAAGLRHAG